MEFRRIQLEEVGSVDDVVHWLSVLCKHYNAREPFEPGANSTVEVIQTPDRSYSLVIHDDDSNAMAIVPLGERHSILTAEEMAVRVIQRVKYLDPGVFDSQSTVVERLVVGDFLKGELRLSESLDRRFSFDVLVLSQVQVNTKPEISFLRTDMFDQVPAAIAPRHLPLMERVLQHYDRLTPVDRWALLDDAQLMTRINLNYVYALPNDSYVHVVVDYAIPRVGPDAIGSFTDRLRLVG